MSLKKLSIAATSIVIANVVWPVSPIQATDRFWVGPNGGTYFDPNNWLPGRAPVGPDNAFFGQNYDVTAFFFNNDWSHNRLIVRNSSNALNLGGATLQLTAAAGAGVVVGDLAAFVTSLDVLDGTLLSINGSIATAANSDGTLTVGAGGTWTLSGDLSVGNGGHGILNVHNGGQLSSVNATIGQFSGSNGIFDVRFKGSNWSNSGVFVVGGLAQGGGLVRFGASLEVDGIVLGQSVNSSGSVAVLDPGSTLTSTDAIEVGLNGEGHLFVSAGGVASSAPGPAYIGRNSTGRGEVNAFDGGTWNVGAFIIVGDSGDGTMNISGTSLVTSNGISLIAASPSSTGEVTLTGNGSQWCNPTGPIIVGPGGQGILTIGAGSQVTASPSLQVGGNGIVQGSGTINGGLSNGTEGAIVRPGLSAGTLTVQGNYIQGPNVATVLEIEIGGTTPGVDHDVLAITGSATLGGTLDVALINGFMPSAGDTFAFLSASPIMNQFAIENLPSLPSGLAWQLNYNATDVELEVIIPTFSYRVSQYDPNINDFVLLGFIEPFETALGFEDYYSYSNPDQSQANFPLGEVPDPVNDRSHLYLLSSSTQGLALCFLHDRSVVPNGGVGGGDAEMQWDLFGDPNGAEWIVQDDPQGANDFYTGNPGGTQFTSAHSWGNFADGGMIARFDGTQWAVEAQFTDVGPGPEINGLTSWVAYSSDGSSVTLALELDRPVRIEIVPTPPNPADLDGDGSVSTADLLILFANWGPCADCNDCPADLDGDCIVSTADLLILFANWG